MRYVVKAPAKIVPGAYTLHPYAKLGDETFRTSVEPIPTLPTRNWSQPADVTVHVLDLTVPAGLHIGYIAGDNDVLPETLRQVGIQVDLLDEVALAFGDLSRYDAIVAGIRAYELRPDAMAANPRLLDYVQNGGTLLVLYERDFAWAKLLPAPFRAEMATQAVRVTDQNSPVRFLAPENPLLNSPNKITLDDFKGWEQERGLYFWSTWDPAIPGRARAHRSGRAGSHGWARLCARRQGRVHLYGTFLLPRIARWSAGGLPAVRKSAEPDAASSATPLTPR